MRRYSIPFEKSGKRIEEMVWKFPFFENLEGIMKKQVDGEKILEIELCPDIIDRFLYMPHMIVITNKQLRKNLLNLEKVYKDYQTAGMHISNKNLT